MSDLKCTRCRVEINYGCENHPDIPTAVKEGDCHGHSCNPTKAWHPLFHEYPAPIDILFMETTGMVPP